MNSNLQTKKTISGGLFGGNKDADCHTHLQQAVDAVLLSHTVYREPSARAVDART